MSDTLREIAHNITVMLASSIQHGKGEYVTGYTIQTGALHRIIGLLQGAGVSVVVPGGLPYSPELISDDDLLAKLACGARIECDMDGGSNCYELRMPSLGPVDTNQIMRLSEAGKLDCGPRAYTLRRAPIDGVPGAGKTSDGAQR
jgi:hypothetical protein